VLQREASAVASRLSQHYGHNNHGSNAVGTSEAALAQQLRQLGSQLSTALVGWYGSIASSMDAVAVLKERALPPAEALAQLLWQHWQQPEQQRAARLDLAQAAGTRCCAYLRCGQLEGQGGPGPGEGKGSLRCGGCKAVWYCGTACSHADWREGHNRVCRELAALRIGQDQ
jgi:hypothetical protein